MTIAIYNIATHEVAGIESYDNPRDLDIRRAGFEIECAQRGPDWRLYCDARPFDWDIVDHKPTPAEIAAQRKAEIAGKLAALDAKSLRSLRAVAAGTATTADRSTLDALEAEAVALRKEMAAP